MTARIRSAEVKKWADLHRLAGEKLRASEPPLEERLRDLRLAILDHRQFDRERAADLLREAEYVVSKRFGRG